ncbi:MAG: hypothetical protein C5B58_07005 [Acidobacteria bacterium]|nr:MAG: hypothetical protein C5B58_07005 [Acidobacteriota bacterium]
MTTSVLFDTPQREISSRINAKLSECVSANIITGFLTPSGIKSIVGPIRTRPNLLAGFVVGAATYPGFQALDELVALGIPLDRIRVHLGHTRESGTRKHPIVRHHPMLHSKVYYMELPDSQACAFIGSHNVTSFALTGLNGEAGVVLEGARDNDEFERIRQHVTIATNQAVPYSPEMKEAFAWWTQEFLEGLTTEIAIPRDWATVRTILIFAAATNEDRPKTGEHLYFEIPAGIEQIQTLKTEVHLFLFAALPSDPWEALQRAPTADAKYTGTVLGAENMGANRELKVNWRIEPTPQPTLLKVPAGILRPSPASGMQQVHAQVESISVKPYEYLFERARTSWWPTFSDREELFPEGETDEAFPIRDVRWQRPSDAGWKLVMHLEKGEGPPQEKDQLALELAKPESGSFILVSLRRRLKNR